MFDSARRQIISFVSHHIQIYVTSVEKARSVTVRLAGALEWLVSEACKGSPLDVCKKKMVVKKIADARHVDNVHKHKHKFKVMPQDKTLRPAPSSKSILKFADPSISLIDTTPAPAPTPPFVTVPVPAPLLFSPGNCSYTILVSQPR